MGEIVAKLHPFEPLQRALVHVPAEWTVRELVGSPACEVRIWLEDEEIPPALWGETVIGERRGLVAVRLEGDDLGRSIALLGVAALAVFVPPAAGLAAGSLAAVGASFGIALVGGLLVNALIPPQVPELNDFTVPTVDGRYNAITGIRNSINLYGNLPTLYGRRRFYPPIAANPYSESATFTQSFVSLFALSDTPLEIYGLKAGKGYGRLDLTPSNAALIGNAVRIGDTPIGLFSGWQMQIGRAADITLYTTDVYEEQTQITYDQQVSGSGWVTDNVSNVRTTQQNTYKASIDLVFPRGLWNVDDQGNVIQPKYEYPCLQYEDYYSNACGDEFRILGRTLYGTEYPLGAGPGQYIAYQGGNRYLRIKKLSGTLGCYDERITKRRRCIKRASTRQVWNAAKQVEVQIEWRRAGTTAWSLHAREIISDVTRRPFSKTYTIDFTAGSTYTDLGQSGSDSYDVRVTRVRTYFGNGIAEISDMAWTVLRSYQRGKPIAEALDDVTMLALKIQATDQLSGPLDSLNVEATAVLPVYTGTSWTEQTTRNPAWAVLDAMRNSIRLDHPVPDAKLDLSGFQDWAAWCDLHEIHYDYLHVGDTMMETVRQIATTGRGSLGLNDGVTFTVVRDQLQTTPRQLISPQNSYGFSMRRDYIDMPHGLRVQYEDRDNDYQLAEVKVYATGYNASTATQFEVLQTQGITDSVQAQKEGAYFLKVAELRPETYTVTMDAEALRVTRGDRVQLQNDAIRVGLGSALVESAWEDGGQQYILIQSKWDLDSTVSYGIRLRRRDGTISLGTIAGEDVGDGRRSVIQPDTTLSDVAHDDLIVYGTVGTETQDCIITSMEFHDDFDATLTLKAYDANIPAVDELAYPQYSPTITSIFRLTSPEPPTITLSSDGTTYVLDDDGTLKSGVSVYWELPFGSKIHLDSIELRWSQQYFTDDANETKDPAHYDTERYDLSKTPLIIGPLIGGVEAVVNARVRSVDGKWSRWSDDEHIITVSSVSTILGNPRAMATDHIIAFANAGLVSYWKRPLLVEADNHQKKGTISFWILPPALNVINGFLFEIGEDDSSHGPRAYGKLQSSSNQLIVYMAYDGDFGPQISFSKNLTYEWHHAMLRWDTTQVTDTDRIQFFVDGDEQSAGGGSVYPALDETISLFDQNLPYGVGVGHPLKAADDSDSTSASYDGLAEFIMVGGQSLDVSNFRKQDPYYLTSYCPRTDLLSQLFGTLRQAVWLRFQNKTRPGFDTFLLQDDAVPQADLVINSSRYPSCPG